MSIYLWKSFFFFCFILFTFPLNAFFAWIKTKKQKSCHNSLRLHKFVCVTPNLAFTRRINTQKTRRMRGCLLLLLLLRVFILLFCIISHCFTFFAFLLLHFERNRISSPEQLAVYFRSIVEDCFTFNFSLFSLHCLPLCVKNVRKMYKWHRNKKRTGLA